MNRTFIKILSAKEVSDGIQKLRGLEETEDQKRKAAEGFAERLEQFEKKFKRVELNELAKYLGREKAKSIIENGSLIVKKEAV